MEVEVDADDVSRKLRNALDRLWAGAQIYSRTEYANGIVFECICDTEGEAKMLNSAGSALRDLMGLHEDTVVAVSVIDARRIKVAVAEVGKKMKIVEEFERACHENGVPLTVIGFRRTPKSIVVRYRGAAPAEIMERSGMIADTMDLNPEIKIRADGDTVIIGKEV